MSLPGLEHFLAMTTSPRSPNMLPVEGLAALGRPGLTPEAAPTSTTNTAANSSVSSLRDMEKDIKESAGFPGEDKAPESPSDHEIVGQNEKDIEVAGDVSVAAPQAVNPMDPSQFPDGGLEAWTVVFGAACGIGVSFGWINCKNEQAYLEAPARTEVLITSQASESSKITTKLINSRTIPPKRLPGSHRLRAS
jgi:hypothetical protein